MDPLPWQRTSTSLLVRRDPSPQRLYNLGERGATIVQRLINVRAMIVPRGREIAHRVRTSLLECSIARGGGSYDAQCVCTMVQDEGTMG